MRMPVVLLCPRSLDFVSGRKAIVLFGAFIWLGCLIWSVANVQAAGRDPPPRHSSKESHRDYAAALAAWLPLAKAGNPLAQFEVGNLFAYRKIGVPNDRAAGNNWWRKAAAIWRRRADSGDADALYRLARLYDLGRGVKRDPKFALVLFRKSAEQGNKRARFQLRRRLKRANQNDRNKNTRDIPRLNSIDERELSNAVRFHAEQMRTGFGPLGKNPRGAFEILHNSAKAGDKLSQFEVALYYEGHWPEIVERDYAKARKWLLKAANKRSDGRAELRLGAYYLQGIGVRSNRAIAIDWIRKFSKKPNRGGTIRPTRLLVRMLESDGFSENEKIRRVCYANNFYRDNKFYFLCKPELSFGADVTDISEEHISARFALGHSLLEHGDHEAALLALQPLAELGHVKAQFLVGEYYSGWQNLMNDTDTRFWLNKAAQKGYAPAQLRLGQLLMWGRAGPKDVIGGRRWIELSLGQNLPETFEYIFDKNWYPESSGNRVPSMLLRAANAGLRTAQIDVADILESSMPGNPPNYVESANWLRKAAIGGLPGNRPQREIYPHFGYVLKNAWGLIDARLRLAVYYLRGYGVKPNRSTALRWVRAATEEKFSIEFKHLSLASRLKYQKKLISKAQRLLEKFEANSWSHHRLAEQVCLAMFSTSPICKRRQITNPRPLVAPVPHETATATGSCRLAVPDNVQLIAYGVYEGTRRSNWGLANKGRHEAQEIAVHIPAKEKKAFLVLTAYEPVIWVLNPAAIEQIHGILLMGYYSQAVANVPQTIPVLMTSAVDRDKSPCGFYAYAYKQGSKREGLERRVKEITGRQIDQFVGKYRTSAFPLGTSTPHPNIICPIRSLADVFTPDIPVGTAGGRASARRGSFRKGLVMMSRCG